MFHICNLLFITRLSEWLNQRTFVAIFTPLWTLPCIIALRFWPGVIKDAWGTYALITVYLAYPYSRTCPLSNLLCHVRLLLTHTRCTRRSLDIQKRQQRRHPHCRFGLVQCKHTCNPPTHSPWFITNHQSHHQISAQISGVASAFIYKEHDKPLYKKGNTTLLAVNILSIFVFLCTKAYYVWRNKQKARIWSGMSEAEREDYIKNSPVKGPKRLDFQFAH